jgi:hypothetical protein
MNPNQQVGGLGEQFLAVWARQAGIHHNASRNDYTGWDHLLEFPLGALDDPDNPLPLDRGFQPLKCLVQVKATNTRRGFIAIKMSNWKHLTEVPVPTFLVVMEFGGEDAPQRAFVVHIGPKLIRRVKKRLRELSAKGHTELHKHTMRVTYGDHHHEIEPNATGLRKALLRPVNGSPADYAANKVHLLETVGYDEGGLDVEVSIDVPEKYRENPAEYLVDFSIGLVDEMRAPSLKAWDNRFGIRAAQPEADVEAVIRKMGGGSDAAVIFTTKDRTERCRLNGQLTLPHELADQLAEDQMKARFTVPFVDFVVRFTTAPQFRFNIDFPANDNERPLRSYKPAADLIHFLHHACENGKDAEIAFEVGGEVHNLFYMNAGSELEATPEPHVRAAQSIRRAWELASHFGVQDELEVPLKEIIVNEDALRGFARLVSPTATGLKVEATFRSRSPVEDEKVAIPSVLTMPFGKFRFAFVIAVVGSPSLKSSSEDGYDYAVTSRDVRLMNDLYFPYDRPPTVTIRELKERAAETLKAEGLTPLVMEFQGDN